ncbi:hypothetical protein KKA53_02470 [Candidatus Dependentiae bacterium]|nr:hypothetical protein [Candidatus Dependentiae bacterium]
MNKLSISCFLLGVCFLPIRANLVTSSREDVFRALLACTQDISLESSTSPRGKSNKKNKKFIKRLVKELLITTLHLALEAVAGSKRQVELRDNLCAVLRAEGKTVKLDPYNIPLLFDELFAFYLEKLESLQGMIETKILEKTSIDDEGSSVVFVRAAVATVNKIDLTSARASWPAILCFVKIIADIGTLVLDRETKDSQDNFVKKVVVLVKDLRDFVAADGLLDSFEKMSHLLAQLHEAGSDVEVQKIVQGLLETSEDGVVFLKELFSSVNLYLKDKLAAILSELSSSLLQEMPSVWAD